MKLIKVCFFLSVIFFVGLLPAIGVVPSIDSTVGQVVYNPLTSTNTTVSALVTDPAGTTTAGTTSFVKTADGYVFFVRKAGSTIYTHDTPPVGLYVAEVNTNTCVAKLQLAGHSDLVTIKTGLTSTEYGGFFSEDSPGVDIPSVIENGVNGVRDIRTGTGGSNGRNGALVVAPRSGGAGHTGPTVNLHNSTTISTSSRIGIEAASIGGAGGKGGNSYLSWYSGRDGGDGGQGGFVNVVNNSGVQVATTGANNYGIFAYSRSGQAGNGGSGFVAPGGGTGGHASDGGSVQVTNYGNISTTGNGAYGIYGLSVSGNGGNGGSQWGLVGRSGSGGYGGNGGTVSVMNSAGATIHTTGSQAHGIYAESVGGSGGSSGTSGNLILSLQGAADNGGNGGRVSVVNNGTILTEGANSRGIFAQSVGGGGGSGGTSGGLIALGGSGSNGGNAGSVTVENSATGVIKSTADAIFAQSVGGSGGCGSNSGGLVAIGGSGAKAGNGGNVSVTNSGKIETEQDHARGIVAQSIGGGGGDGGFCGGLVAVGGSGTGGGNSGNVSVSQGGTIATKGQYAIGVLAQSVGGGGGDGGSCGGMVAVGGSGNGGGNSGRVSVSQSGKITTEGHDATGVFAQSVGGGGGNGGSSGSISAFAGVAVGGTGGGGGAGGNVNVFMQGQDANTASLLRTTGARSTGLFAQSVGGGGGNGGGAVQVTGGYGGALSVAVGGAGGSGGDGGDVSLTGGNGKSVVDTSGDFSKGVLLQSVGGGGGNGGYAVAVALAAGDTAAASLSVGVGGSGGSGGDGGTVDVGTFDSAGHLSHAGFNGSILTRGESAAGFTAQSIGGGGGNGGVAVSASGSGAGAAAAAIAVGVGGKGAVGGTGGDLSVGLDGTIITEGNNSSAMLVQSVGGGGGNGGGSVTGAAAGAGAGAGSVGVSVGGSGGAGNSGGDVVATLQNGIISTKGTNSTGIIVQSIGGGGGNGGFNVTAGGSGAGVGSGTVTVGIGGSGANGGNGGRVSFEQSGSVYTKGDNAGGISVQSIGGGGGSGGFNIAGNGSGAGVGSGSVSYSMGGTGGAGGTGGSVKASTSEGPVVTEGNNSVGILAQSIGGGGGNGGFNISGSGSGAGVGSGNVTVGVGGFGGSGSEGSSVALTVSSDVKTEGANSAAVVAQSIGGGGGNGGFNVSGGGTGAGVGSGNLTVGLGGWGADGGDAGSVTLNQAGYVYTTGDNSGGILIQSLGGGGGNGGFNVSGGGSGAGVGSGAVSLSLGGTGGAGGAGGAVEASTSAGSVVTEGDNSAGILAQSLGGGGGNGGFNISASGSGAGVGSGNVTVGVGGFGGSGSEGSSVALTVSNDVQTAGNNSAAVVAQSIGGGGGNGGFNISGGGSGAGVGSGDLEVAFGGKGAAGGDAGSVTLNQAGTIYTTGDNSGGILAQSLGGGGGNGGFTVSGGGSGAGVGSGAVSLSLGGTGGAGGSGGAVVASTSAGPVVTEGDHSAGILAQSLGGGGGNGGFNISGSGSGAGVGSGNVTVNVGGFGGAGSESSTVDLTVSNDVWTAGDYSAAVVAQSIGGGGGNGGFTVTGGGSGAGMGSGNLTVGFGGFGGDGGAADQVTLHQSGSVYTDGDSSMGIVAQSLGGGGGNGGFSVAGGGSGAGTGSGAVSFSLGGKGGEGGAGAAVVASTSAGTVTTLGDNSGGILAQSIGGGGGNGGFSVSGSGSGAGVGSGNVSLALGGFGGDGSDGSTVDLTVSNDVQTAGHNSSAVMAQSIGGGGGNGGFNVTGSASGAGTGSGNLTAGLGGFGGDGGAADTVTLNQSGSVRTEGDNSMGIVAQSLGGGGGNGGFNVSGSGSGAGTGSGAVSLSMGGNGGAGGASGAVVASTTSGTVTTLGDNSMGILAQSVGGGGGNGGFNVSCSGSGAGTGSGAVTLGLGGFGGAGSDGSTVDLTVSNDVQTAGDNSGAVAAQSIGGGGGNGGFNVTIAGSGAGTGSGAVDVGLGGFGGDAAMGGSVRLNQAGSVYTEGDNSAGILAQSIGGGGGNGGFNVNLTGSGAGTGSGAVNVGLGGAGAGGGNSGSVVASTSQGNVKTLGDNSIGILAQSLGGGGGNGGFNVSIAGTGAGKGSGALGVGIGGASDDGGAGSTVDLIVSNTVQTAGDSSAAVVAQSIGGGGGNGGFNVTVEGSGSGKASGTVGVGLGGSGGGGGDADRVSLDMTGDILTEGANSAGLIAQSVGGGGGNGGFNVTAALNVSGKAGGAASIGLGGSAGAGGDSAAVVAALDGDVFTKGDNSAGVTAQSIGGGGGNGGFNLSGAVNLSKDTAGAVAVGLGGSGGDGGDAGNVENKVTGLVQTTGQNSSGVLTQSLGGGGGNGGLNVSGTLTASKSNSGGLAVGVGGFGGSGGDAGSASSVVTGGVSTFDDDSIAVFTQSQGGGGGNGAVNVSGSLNLSKEGGGALGVGVGGFGGDGGDAGDVSSTVVMTAEHAQIGTTGDNSSVVFAQSLGGGGGNGGVNVSGAVNLSGKKGAAIGVGVGGFGGGGGEAGDVTVDVSGTLVSEGDNSQGLLAQSIGGGGGNGGVDVSGAMSLTTSTGLTASASIGVGGFGGGGGDAGDVDVDFDGTIQAIPLMMVSQGVYTNDPAGASHGLQAQSIGGSGGNGAVNVSGGLAINKGGSKALLVGVGGFGGTGGDAGSVDVDVTGSEYINSYGKGKSAIAASSIGGGGGSGGLNVSGGIVSDSPLIVGIGGFGGNGGLGGDVTVHSDADLYAGAAAGANGVSSAGLMAQSIGGGGGDGGLNVSGGVSISKEKGMPSITFGIGGFGGAGAISGDVDVQQQGQIHVFGERKHGIFAQSIAGGGGNGALNISGELNWADSRNSGGETDLSIIAGLGGHGGQGADAGNVQVVSAGDSITTAGDYSRGIFAQSVGGGGGTGGMNVTGIFTKNSNPITAGVGGFGSGGGHGGQVSVLHGSSSTQSGPILTDGEGAIGIEASSIGGGGGDAGMNFVYGKSQATASTSGGTSGSTERKHPEHTGVDDSVFSNYDNVLDELEGRSSGSGSTSKTGSTYSVQLAVGGFGGDPGNGNTAQVENYSDIVTLQKGSHGIMAQSIGGGGGNAALNYAQMDAPGSTNSPTRGINVAIGGGVGSGGDGDVVNVLQVGNIETFGDRSYGILAQSIGGGGGNAGTDTLKSDSKGTAFNFTLGQQGGAGGSGADVSLSSDGWIQTHGQGSFGLLAQSLGNGGGNSSSTTIELAVKENNVAGSGAMSLGANGSSGGRAGNVMLTASGFVGTKGTNTHAIIAQSIGGGGGTAGSAGTGGSTFSLGLGGTGGAGGVGGTVTVESLADVRTEADGSIGILAQSIGGGGGVGGTSKSDVTASGSGMSISIGGAGGTGMSSDRVTVNNGGVIITDGLNAHGILAQSLGGGGGNGGAVSSTRKDSDTLQESTTALLVSIGGVGGTGGVAKDVMVTNTGGIGTTNANSIGILAQSIGGGGGNASVVKNTFESGSGGGYDLSVGIGGNGGTGGVAGNVVVHNMKDAANAQSGRIITYGDYSHGIMASSIGGGGGNGNTAIVDNSAGGSATNKAKSMSFSLGGNGGSGGTGGDVVASNDGLIVTHGYKAHGILAQSIGGGGGNAGASVIGDVAVGVSSNKAADSAAFSLSIGGTGGDGNTSGAVAVNNTGTIEVNGDGACGIYAQSVGGGGGDGGFSSALSHDLTKNPKSSLLSSLMNVGLGGFGGDGGDSGDVHVENSGTINVYGNNAHGIFAQSVSGGGGNAGVEMTSPTWMAVDTVLSSVLGGREGTAGIAGKVTVNSTGDINVFGTNSQAVLVQSVNGGGGNANLFLDISQRAAQLDDTGAELPFNTGGVTTLKAALESFVGLGGENQTEATGSEIECTHEGNIYTTGSESDAVVVQSIGGGGGNSRSKIVLNEVSDADLAALLGGALATNSSGGAVYQIRDGFVQTEGDFAGAMAVQSIGGGGGIHSMNLSRVAETNSAGADGIAAARVALGANGAVGSNGGGMNLNYAGDVLTFGEFAPGLVLQSIGAGGGKSVYTGADALNVGLGALGGSSGNGGNIALTNNGLVQTVGELSHGIVLQSIGGGGGLVLSDLGAASVTVSNRTENSGNGGDIDLDQTGNVIANGDRAIAVLAQSLGGGGGTVDRVFMDAAGGEGDSGRINLILRGSVNALGESGIGVFAQSRALGIQENISILLSTNQVVIFGTNGTGVAYSGGADNQLVNNGSIWGQEGVFGWAITGEEGNEYVENNGLVVGQLNLGTGLNRFVNNSHETFIPGPQILLGGPSGMLTQNGAMIIGGVSNAQYTVLDGSFEQTADGDTFSELDFGSADPNVDGGLIDRIVATGTVNLDGSIQVDLLNPQLVPFGHFIQSIFYGDLGVTNNGLELVTAPSVVITYDLLERTGKDVELDYNIDFSPGGMGVNLRGVGKYINRVQAAGSSPELAGLIVNLLYDPNLEMYKETLSQISPDIYGELQVQAIQHSRLFGQQLINGSGYRLYEDGYLFWGHSLNQRIQHGAYDDYKDFTHRTTGFACGVQKAMTEQWVSGIGFSYGDTSSSGYDGRWKSDGYFRQIGASLEYRAESTRIGATLSYGEEFTDVSRVGTAVTPVESQLDREMQTVGAALHASHEFTKGHAYLRPAVEFGSSYLMADGQSEDGAGALNLELEDLSEFHLWVQPSLETGYLIPDLYSSDWSLNLYADISMLEYLTDSDSEVYAGLQGAPAAADSMVVPVDLGQTQIEPSLGVQFLKDSGMSLNFKYSQSVDEVNRRRFDLMLSVPF